MYRPQPNSPTDNVFRTDRQPREATLDPKPTQGAVAKTISKYIPKFVYFFSGHVIPHLTGSKLSKYLFRLFVFLQDSVLGSILKNEMTWSINLGTFFWSRNALHETQQTSKHFSVLYFFARMVKQKQPQDCKTAFETKSLLLAKILLRVARQAPTKFLCTWVSGIRHCLRGGWRPWHPKTQLAPLSDPLREPCAELDPRLRPQKPGLGKLHLRNQPRNWVLKLQILQIGTRGHRTSLRTTVCVASPIGFGTCFLQF